MDLDGNEMIDINEFVRTLERFGLHTTFGGRRGTGGLSRQTVQALFDKYDRDGSGFISYNEFADSLFRP